MPTYQYQCTDCGEALEVLAPSTTATAVIIERSPRRVGSRRPLALFGSFGQGRVFCCVMNSRIERAGRGEVVGAFLQLAAQLEELLLSVGEDADVLAQADVLRASVEKFASRGCIAGSPVAGDWFGRAAVDEDGVDLGARVTDDTVIIAPAERSSTSTLNPQPPCVSCRRTHQGWFSVVASRCSGWVTGLPP